MYFAQQLVKMSEKAKWFGAFTAVFKLKCVTQPLLCYCTGLLGFDQLRLASLRGLSIISQGFSQTEKT